MKRPPPSQQASDALVLQEELLPFLLNPQSYVERQLFRPHLHCGGMKLQLLLREAANVRGTRTPA